jgi:hypothetical protein
MKKSRLREALKAYKFEFTLLAIILICFFGLIGYYAYAGKLVDNDGNPIKFCIQSDSNNSLWERIVRKWKIMKTEK